MGEFRSEAEQFVSYFLDYIYKEDIKDELNKRTQKMERSPGVQDLVRRAQAVFPERAKDGNLENKKLSEAQIDAAIVGAPNVADLRKEFGKRTQANGGTRKMLRDLYAGEPGAAEAVREFLDYEDGKPLS